MAWTVSGLFGQTLADILSQTTAIDLTGNGDFYIALMNNSVTPDYDAAAASTALGAGTWSGNEVTGTNWAAGGVSLGQPTVTVASPAATQLKWDTPDVSVANTTISTQFYGGLIYDNTIATPVADQGLCGIYFGGTGYTTSAGTLTITVDANGWFYIDYA